MINRKLAAAFIVPLMVATIGMAKAEDATASDFGGFRPPSCENDECRASVKVSAELKEVCEVTANGGKLDTKIESKDGKLETALTPSFKLVSSEKQKLELTARVEDTTGTKDALSLQGGVHYLTLGNTKVKPTAAAIANCEGAFPIATMNDDCIAYTITGVQATGSTMGSLSYSSGNPNKYHTTANAGTTVITLTTGISPRANTYSFGTDKSGSYKAELTLTAASI